jgi:hypothetical protein
VNAGAREVLPSLAERPAWRWASAGGHAARALAGAAGQFCVKVRIFRSVMTRPLFSSVMSMIFSFR